MTKEATAYLLIATLAFLFVYYKGYRRPAWILSALLIMVACAPTLFVSEAYYGTTRIAPLDYLINDTSSPLAWLLFNFGWSWLYVALRERKPPYVDVGIVLTLCFAGMIPALLLYIYGGSAGYFLDLQRFVALAFLLAWLPSRLGRRAVLLLSCATVLAAGNVALSAVKFAAWQVSVRPTQSAVLDQLDQMAALPDKSHSALYIPPDNPYWTLLHSDRSCTAVAFLAPAFTGIALVDGFPQACHGVAQYGYDAYTDPPKSPCQRARDYGLTRVAILDQTIRFMNCN